MTDSWEKTLQLTFLAEAEDLLRDTEASFLELERAGGDKAVIERLFRLAHSLKGSAGAAGFQDLAAFTHALESLLLEIKKGAVAVDERVSTLLLACNDHLTASVRALKADPAARVEQGALVARIADAAAGKLAAPAPALKAPPADVGFELWDEPAPAPKAAAPAPAPAPAPASAPADDHVRVRLDRLDRLMNDVGELVVLQTVLMRHRHLVGDALVQRTIAQLSKISRSIQDTAMGLRMVPLRPTFQKMQRIVRDASRALGKDVALTLEGEDTELDKTVLDLVSDPLVHLVRNAVDHGLETPDARAAAGKPRTGAVRLAAFHKSGHIVIEVSEDGRGLDPAALVAKAAQKGLVPAGATLSDDEARALIFRAGFSTKDQVTDLSGRGVGLDVVKTNVERLGGAVEVESVEGAGTTFRLVLPLTLAIVEGMVVRVGDERYVVPLAAVHETLTPAPKDVQTIAGQGELLGLRGEWLPLHRLARLLGRAAPPPGADVAGKIALVVRGPVPFAALVDDIVDRQQVVIKRVGETLQGLPGIGGAAVLGDGRAALILDLSELKEAA